MERRNAWKDYDKKETKELEKLCKDYRKFLDNGKTERECVKYIVHLAEKSRIPGFGKCDPIRQED